MIDKYIMFSLEIINTNPVREDGTNYDKKNA